MTAKPPMRPPRKPRELTKLGRLRVRAGFETIEQLADHLGRGKSVVSRWESGEREPQNVPDRLAYAEALGITIGRLGQLVYELSAEQ